MAASVRKSVRLPTRRRDWRLMGRTVRLVLTIPAYAALALVASFLTLSVFSFSQNPDLAWFALSKPISVGRKVTILEGLYPFTGTVFSLEVSAMLVAIAALAGANVSMVTYHLFRHGLSAKTSGGSVVGVILGILGAGCAACGTVLLAGILSLFGATGLLTLLPLDGLEFSLLAGIALVLSTYWIADGMRGGEVNGCPIDI
jgi:hypothetical protein